MTKSARFIRFNFWQLNIIFILFGAIYVRLLGVNILHLTFDYLLLLPIILLIISMLYRRRLGIKSNSALIFAEDELERSIIYKIHSTLLIFYTTTIFLLLLGIPFITIFTSDIYIALAIIAGALILIGFLGNIIYYCTWLKYYQKL